jgi:hypothetical protein
MLGWELNPERKPQLSNYFLILLFNPHLQNEDENERI